MQQKLTIKIVSLWCFSELNELERIVGLMV